ncbi:hypothetical protein [Staphylococcus simulans]|uniref:hypothetical protein n=1 Tax=Staphylococcus simulans TaxID=1286 RepID=UPI001F1FE40B|nr:hypothetical protein [Staphylococcus simulans]MCE5025546.1 hypothetical protein [Staphylococcus simulans]
MTIKSNSINNHTKRYYYYVDFIVQFIRDKKFNASRQYHSLKQNFPSSEEALEGLLEVVEQKYPHVCHNLNDYRKFVQLIDDLNENSIWVSYSDLYRVYCILVKEKDMEKLDKLIEQELDVVTSTCISVDLIEVISDFNDDLGLTGVNSEVYKEGDSIFSVIEAPNHTTIPIQLDIEELKNEKLGLRFYIFNEYEKHINEFDFDEYFNEIW